MSDADIIKWLNHWLAAFDWHSDDRKCHMVFRDPYRHNYEIVGDDLRGCVARAVEMHPTSATFIGITRGQGSC
jgi:hypothetical protein